MDHSLRISVAIKFVLVYVLSWKPIMYVFYNILKPEEEVGIC